MPALNECAAYCERLVPGAALRALVLGLQLRGARLSDGKPIVNGQGAVAWLLERLHAGDVSPDDGLVGPALDSLEQAIRETLADIERLRAMLPE